MHASGHTVHLASVCLIVASVCSAPGSALDCPELVGRWPYGPASAVALSGDFAFVGSGTVLLIVDLSTPATPVVVAEVGLEATVAAIAVAGDHAYVANTEDGLRVIDISTPTAPSAIGHLDVTRDRIGKSCQYDSSQKVD